MELSVSSGWPDTSIFGLKKYRRARFEAHNALFWMARGVNSYREKEDNNKHLELMWETSTSTLKTRVFCDNLQVGLNFLELEIYFCEDGKKVKHSFWFDERTPAYVEAWYLVELLHREKDQNKFSTELPFHSDNFFLGDTEEHNASSLQPELRALHNCFTKGADILSQVQLDAAADREALGEEYSLSVQPETFTLGFELCSLTDNGTKIVVGLSAGDNLRPAPFFFVSANRANRDKKSHVLDFKPENLLFLNTINDKRMNNKDIIDILFRQVKNLAG
tara:strand:+ start:268 stop:1098 length:831 start_codon:yes stop_codon:yes gene_type:complete